MSDFKPRRGEPGQRVQYGSTDGTIRRLKADDDGLVTAKSAEDDDFLAMLGLSVARTDESKKAEPAKKEG